MALLQRFSFILLFITLVGCGGSSGGFDDTSEGTDGGTSDAITITLAISDRNLSQATPQTLAVSVMQGNTPVSDKLVTFSISNEDLASFSTDVNASSTDENGQAEIGLLAGLSSGDGLITATVDGVDSNSITFTSAGDGAIQDGTILILEISAKNLSQVTPQILTATLMQGTTPVSDQLITFTINNNSLAVFDTEVNTRSTNQAGKAEIVLLAGTSAGDGSVTATVNGISSNAVTFSSAGDGGVTLILTISDENVSQATPQTLTATMMQGTTPISAKLVTFSISNAELASFSTDVNTSSTNINGEAEIGLIAGVSSGDGSITASAEGFTSNSITFKSAGDGDVVGEPVASAVSLFASSQQIASSGDDEVTLITIAKDENNNLVEGVNVSFSATSGQIEVVNSVTGTDGKASAILKTNNEPTNRLITVTSTSGQVADSVDVQVIGTSINLTGSSSLAINDENSFFIQVLNSESVGVANVTVDLSLSDEADEDSAAITIVESVTTDSSGQINFSVTGTTGGTNTIIATALGATVSHTVSVQADSFLFSSFGNGEQTVDPEVDSVPDVFLSSSSARNSAEIEVTWTQSNTPVADGTIVNFTTTRGVITREENITQDGKVSAVIASDNAGKALVTVTGQNGEVILSNQLEFEFVAENVDNISAQASSNSIAPNGDTSTISVIAKDINGNLVKGKIIEFTLTDTSGGNILPATALTDSNGSASTLYTSNSVSAQNGVSIIATVQDAPSKTDTVTLTVADRQLFISLGTGNELEEPTITTYNKQYSVFVTDVDSTPQAGVVLKVSAVPNNYYKGEWVKVLDESGDFSSWGASYSTIPPCPNEDLNVDGILDVGEDTNNDGKLTPGNVVSASGDVTTDEFGQAVIDIRYAQSFATWVDINLIVSAKVSGTENSTQTRFSLPVLATDVLNEDVTPPTSGIGLASPFGVVGDCSVSD